MPINAYVGLPRSGKSFSVTKFVLLPKLKLSKKFRDAGKEGIEIYTNIPVNNELIEKEYGQAVHQLDLAECAKEDWDWKEATKPGSLIILDELWRLWPSGMATTRIKFSDKEFLAEHGHNVASNGHTTEVVLVCQDLAQIANFARQLVAYTYRSVKMDNIGMDNRFNVYIYSGAVTGNSPSQSRIVRQMIGEKYDPAVFPYYKSATKSDTGDVGDESSTDKRNNALFDAKIKIALVGLVCAAGLIYWTFKSFFGAGGESSTVESDDPVMTAELRQQDRDGELVALRTQLEVQGEKLTQLKAEAEQRDFIDHIDRAYVEIAHKRGRFFDYVLKIYTVEGGESLLDEQTLRRVGVSVTSLDRCAARLTTERQQKFVFCRSDDEERGNSLHSSIRNLGQ